MSFQRVTKTAFLRHSIVVPSVVLSCSPPLIARWSSLSLLSPYHLLILLWVSRGGWFLYARWWGLGSVFLVHFVHCCIVELVRFPLSFGSVFAVRQTISTCRFCYERLQFAYTLKVTFSFSVHRIVTSFSPVFSFSVTPQPIISGDMNLFDELEGGVSWISNLISNLNSSMLNPRHA